MDYQMLAVHWDTVILKGVRIDQSHHTFISAHELAAPYTFPFGAKDGPEATTETYLIKVAGPTSVLGRLAIPGGTGEILQKLDCLCPKLARKSAI